MNPTYDFRGQVAFVTGASQDMGLATAQTFAAGGASVVLADADGADVTQAAGDLTAAGHQLIGVTCDVAEEDQVAAAVSARSQPTVASTWRSTAPVSKCRPAIQLMLM